MLAVSLALAVCDAAWLRPYLFRSPQQLVHLGLTHPSNAAITTQLPAQLWREWHAKDDDGKLAAYDWTVGDIDLAGGKPRRVIATLITPGLVKLVGFPMAAGREFTKPEEFSGQTAILSYSAWKSAFAGRTDAVGQTLSFQGSTLTIVGVMGSGFSLPLLPPDPWLYIVQPPIPPGQLDLNAGSLRVLSRTSNPEALKTQLRTALDSLLHDVSLPKPAPLLIVRPISKMSPTPVEALPLFAAMIGAVLGLGWLNLILLVSVAGKKQQPSWAVHRFLGARPGQLFRLESTALLLVCVAATALANVVAYLIMERLGGRLALAIGLPRVPSLAIWASISTWLVATAVAISLCAVTLRLLLPEFFQRPAGGDASRSKPGRRLGIVLGLQMTLAGTLIVIGSISAGMFARLAHTGMGLDVTNVVSTSFSPNHPDVQSSPILLQEVTTALRSTPGVEGVSAVDLLPFHGIAPTREWTETGPGDRSKISIRRVDASYFSLLRIRLLSGRSLVDADRVSPPAVAVISQSLATRDFDGNAIGKQLVIGDRPPLTIVGICDDVRDQSIDRVPEPTIYLMFSDLSAKRFAYNRGILVRLASDSAQFREFVSQTMERFAPLGRSAEVVPVKDRMGQATVAPELYAWMTGVCAWFAFLLAISGCHSVCGQVAAALRYAMAIRVACGATRWEILRRFLWFGLPPIGIGLALGITAGALSSQALVHVIYREAAIGLAPTIASIAAISAASVFALLVPAIQVARQDPLAQLSRRS